MYNQLQHSGTLLSAHTVYLCVLCGSENKQRLFLYTALAGFYKRYLTHCSLVVYYMYHQFNIQ